MPDELQLFSDYNDSHDSIGMSLNKTLDHLVGLLVCNWFSGTFVCWFNWKNYRKTCRWYECKIFKTFWYENFKDLFEDLDWCQ